MGVESGCQSGLHVLLSAVAGQCDEADVVSELEREKAGEVVELLEEEDRREITQLLAYPEDCAGGIMQLEVVSVREDHTVQRGIEKIRLAFGDVKENFYYVYVVDRAGRLAGKIPLARIARTSPGALVDWLTVSWTAYRSLMRWLINSEEAMLARLRADTFRHGFTGPCSATQPSLSCEAFHL